MCALYNQALFISQLHDVSDIELYNMRNKDKQPMNEDIYQIILRAWMLQAPAILDKLFKRIVELAWINTYKPQITELVEIETDYSKWSKTITACVMLTAGTGTFVLAVLRNVDQPINGPRSKINVTEKSKIFVDLIHKVNLSIFNSIESSTWCEMVTQKLDEIIESNVYYDIELYHFFANIPDYSYRGVLIAEAQIINPEKAIKRLAFSSEFELFMTTKRYETSELIIEEGLIRLEFTRNAWVATSNMKLDISL